MKTLGIDPGLTGAFALYDHAADTLAVFDMPTLVIPKSGGGKRTELDVYAIAKIMDDLAPLQLRAFVELVGPTPQMGVTSSFSFGGSYWAVRMACAAHFLPTELVPPQRWKKALAVKAGPGKSDAVRARASALLPRHAHLWTRVKDEGRAEASLIAYFGAQTLERAAA